MGQNLPNTIMQFAKMDGSAYEPLALAVAHFFLTGTDTPSPVYEDVDLAVPHGTTVTADANGLFPPIYFDSDIPLRMVLVEAGGDLNDPFIDIDPVTQTLLITAGQIADGAIEDKLGYTPVDPDADVEFTEYVRLTKVLTAADGTEAGFRAIPVTAKNANYTLIMDDIGRMLRKDDTGSYTWTIPLNTNLAMPIGSRVYFDNGNTTNLTLAKDVGVTMRVAGDGTFTDQTTIVIAPGENGWMHKVGTNTWVVQKTQFAPTVTVATLPVSGFAGQRLYVSDLGGGAGSIEWDAVAGKWVRLRNEGLDIVTTNVGYTWTPFSSAPAQRHTGTLTADRTVTLATANAYNGMKARFTRTGSGAFNLSIGGLKNLATNTWCEVTYDAVGTAWFLSAYGAL